MHTTTMQIAELIALIASCDNMSHVATAHE